MDVGTSCQVSTVGFAGSLVGGAPGCLSGQGLGDEAGSFTHRVRIFGMWLKLVTWMRLMLLLLRVLQTEDQGHG